MIKKHYINSETSEHTDKATIAMAWHRQGVAVQVNTFTEKGLVNVVHVQGINIESNQVIVDRSNRKRCESIALDLESFYNGRVYQCPCGESITVPSDWSGEKYKCPYCGEVHDGDVLEQLSLWDYFDDFLDVEYRIGSDRQLRSVQIMVAFGGPNIYIDTATRQVELYWWLDHASYPINHDVCNEIDSIFEEFYNC